MARSKPKKKDQPNIQAEDNSIAVGGITVGGDVRGSITIGHGYTVEQVSLLLKEITTNYRRKPFDGRCPYKGLEVFEEEDADLFFGRERLVADLVSRVKESRTVFITGPSGSGKSSLVRAGLIHALKDGALKSSDRWLYETMKPGREPIKELSLAFSRLKGPDLTDYFLAHANETDVLHRCAEAVLSGRKEQRFLLFIDQFEEVFTQINQEEERQAFLNMLAYAGTAENGRVIVLFAMRSDFVSNCATYPALNELLSQEFRQIGAMQPEELVAAIALPAKEVGLPIEEELIARTINDMKGEPGALPLMQFALKDLFDAQQERGGVIALTLKDYLQHGGIQKSLERHADASLAALDEEGQALARSIFSGLIEIGRGTVDTKRTALFDELVPANTKADEVLAIVQKLADARLIITDEQAGKDTVTISHEKLIEAWPWLKKLVDENRDVIALQNEIASDAKEWEEHLRDPSYLYTGARLANAREQLDAKKLVLSGTAQDFVVAGQAQQRRSQRTRVFGVAVPIALTMLAIILFSYVFSTNAANQAKLSENFAKTQQASASTADAIAAIAQANAEEAQKQSQIALARQLAAQSESIFSTYYLDQTLGFLLAIESMQLVPNVSSAQILQKNTIRTVHSVQSPVNSVAFSSDGQYVISGSGDGTARVLKTATGEEIARTTHEDGVKFVAFSLDGKYAVSVSSDFTARVWEATTGNEVARIRHDWYVSSVAFSPDSKYIVSSGCDGSVWGGPCSEGSTRVWEITTEKEIARMTSGGTVEPVAFSPDGQYVVSGGCDKQELENETVLCKEGSARVWEASTGKEVSHMTYQGAVTSLALSPDGKYVVSGGCEQETEGPLNEQGSHSVICMEGSIWVWEAATGKKVAHMDSHASADVIAFSPDGKYVASGGCNLIDSKFDCLENLVNVWEAETGNEVANIFQDGVVHSLAFSPMGEYVVAGVGSTAHVWQTTTEDEIAHMTYLAEVNSVAFSPDGNHVAVGSADWRTGTDVWEIAKGAELARIANVRLTSSVAFSPDGKLVASGGVETARIWEVSTEKEVGRLNVGNFALSVAFSPDGKYLLVTSLDDHPSADIWEIATGKRIAQTIYNQHVYSATFSPDGTYVATTGCDEGIDNACLKGSARVWEALTGKEIARITRPGRGFSIAFSPDNKYIVAGGCDDDVDYSCTEGFARIWETFTGKEISHVTHEDSVTFVAFVQLDGKDYVLSSDSKSARVWEATTGKEIARMIHDGSVHSLAVSSDGRYLVSGGCDKFGKQELDQYGCREGYVQLWDVVTGRRIARVVRDSEVRSLAFSPDGKYFAAGGCNNVILSNGACVDGSAHVWDVSTGNEIARMIQNSRVNLVAFSPDSKYLVSAGEDSSVRVWIYRPEDLIANACSRVSRNLTRAEWKQYIGDALPYQAVCPNLPVEPEATATPSPTP